MRRKIISVTEAAIETSLLHHVGHLPDYVTVAENGVLVDITAGTGDWSRVQFFYQGVLLFTRRVYFVNVNETFLVRIEFTHT